MTQATVSQLSGIPQGVWSFIENGHRDPTLEQAFVLERFTSGAIEASSWVDRNRLAAVPKVRPKRAA